MLYSSLKPEGYLVKGRKLRLRYVIRSGVVESLKQVKYKRSQDVDYNDKDLPQVKSAYYIPSIKTCKISF